jgi:hypothetical protein
MPTQSAATLGVGGNSHTTALRSYVSARTVRTHALMCHAALDEARSRRDVLAAGAALLAAGSLMGNAQSAWAAKGEYARMELDGRGGSSVSSLGANDIPGAGKIDPYENREAANAEYATRMSDEDMLSSVRSKALEMKTKTFTAVAASVDKQDWKTAKLLLDRDLVNLRRAMNLVSTRGLKAISAAQKGGQPDKVVDEAEKIERTYLNLLNKLAKSLDGTQRKVDFSISRKILDSMEVEWTKWEAATAR